jgi:hypothetical protein
MFTVVKVGETFSVKNASNESVKDGLTRDEANKWVKRYEAKERAAPRKAKALARSAARNA